MGTKKNTERPELQVDRLGRRDSIEVTQFNKKWKIKKNTKKKINFPEEDEYLYQREMAEAKNPL